jgi:hypothetical protein
MQSKGIKTTEFWMVVASAGLMVLNEGLGLKLPSDQIMGFFGAVISYVGGRTWLKTKG